MKRLENIRHADIRGHGDAIRLRFTADIAVEDARQMIEHAKSGGELFNTKVAEMLRKEYGVPAPYDGKYTVVWGFGGSPNIEYDGPPFDYQKVARWENGRWVRNEMPRVSSDFVISSGARIDPDKEKQAAEIAEHNGLISAQRAIEQQRDKLLTALTDIRPLVELHVRYLELSFERGGDDGAAYQVFAEAEDKLKALDALIAEIGGQ